MDLNQEQLKAIQELNNHWQETSDQSKEGLFNFLIGSGLEPNQVNRPLIIAFFQDNEILSTFYTDYHLRFNERQQQKAENRKRLTIERKQDELKQSIVDFEKIRDTATDTDIQEHVQKLSGLTDEIKKTANSKPGQAFKVLTFAEIHDKDIAIKAIIQGMFNKGDKVMIHAMGGLGKSMIATYMALFLAARDNLCENMTAPKFLNQFIVPEPVSTLFLQNENQRAVMHQRVKMMCKGDPRLKAGLKNIFTPEVNDNICLYGKDLGDESFHQWVVDLVRYIEKHYKTKIGLIVIDPLISFHTCDENDNASIRAILDKFASTAEQVDATPLVIHHDNKNGDFRGASSQHDWARCRIQMTKGTEQPDIIDLRNLKASNTKEFKTIKIKMDKDLLFRPHDEKAQGLADENEGQETTAMLADMGLYARKK